MLRIFFECKLVFCDYRHVALCLHTMFGCMVAKEIVDLVHLLETYTDLQNDDGADVTTLHGINLPPVPFTAFPLLR